MKSMKQTLVVLLVAIAHAPLWAGSVGGTGGATEVTQIANNVQLVAQYEQQLAGYVRQGLQLQAEMTNLIRNPASLLGQDIGNIINNVGRIYSGGQAIGGDLARIDRNFATNFKSPTADNLSQSFTRWNRTNTDTLEATLRTAGMHRDQFQSDTDALNALYNESQNTKGNLDSLQTLAKFNASQIQQLQGLKDLVATQNIAMSTYMASQTAKEQKARDDFDKLAQPYSAPPTQIEKAAPIKWNSILFKK